MARLYPEFFTDHDMLYLVYTAIKTVNRDMSRSQINQDCCESRWIQEHPDVALTRVFRASLSAFRSVIARGLTAS